MISIVVLSKNYASSSWCLDELSKIIECKSTNKQIVIPIFYHVDPSDVRNQTGSFAEAFAKFEERTDKVQRWRAALKQVGNISGWDTQAQQKHRSESELIEGIVKGISKILIDKSSNDSKDLVGIDSRIKLVESLFCHKLEDVHIVGIWGMGGIGKTTIAEALFNQMLVEFDDYCFLADVREKSEKHGQCLQEELFSKILEERNQYIGTNLLPNFIIDRLQSKRVLIVLDDVNDSRQLSFLRKKHYFGPGSRIIVTSRDKHLLQQVVDQIYEVEGLNDHEALQLFSFNAFERTHPTKDCMELSKKVVNYAKGNPLALKVLGSALYGKSKRDWESALNELKRVPNPHIHKILRINYDGLDDEEKNIFLDIACFFIGDDIDYVTDILDCCYLSTYSAIRVLIDQSLVTISHQKIGMHDLVQEMGWNIVNQESIKEPGKRSRLWILEDIYRVLKNNTGTEAIEGMFLDISKMRRVHLSSTCFARMGNLRLLNFYYSDLERDCKIYLSQGLESFPDNLRYLRWDGYPLKSLPLNFCSENLVELNMLDSHLKQLWNGEQNLANLKRLKLSYSEHLIKLPNLSRATYLERMELNGCRSLVEVPSSIRHHDKLTLLDLEDCENLRNLPSNICLKSLRTLILSGCSNITKCPKISENLETLYLDGTAIEEVPSSISCCSQLKYLNLRNCKRFERLPSSICKLKFLLYLNLSGCSKFKCFPEVLEIMECLNFLYLDGTAIEELSSSIEHLIGLKCLSLKNCEKLKNLPSSICKLKSLEDLLLSGYSNLKNFPDAPKNVKWINLNGTAIEEMSSSIECFSRLNVLDLGNCRELVSLPSSISNLNSLRKLNLSGCSKLDEFPEVYMGRLKDLNLEGTSIRNLEERLFSLFQSTANLYLTGVFRPHLDLDDDGLIKIGPNVKGPHFDETYCTQKY